MVRILGTTLHYLYTHKHMCDFFFKKICLEIVTTKKNSFCFTFFFRKQNVSITQNKSKIIEKFAFDFSVSICDLPPFLTSSSLVGQCKNSLKFCRREKKYRESGLIEDKKFFFGDRSTENSLSQRVENRPGKRPCLSNDNSLG